MDFGQLTDEDFLNIGDLSEFSDEDIATPISVDMTCLTERNSCNRDYVFGAVRESPASGMSDAVCGRNSGLLPCHDDPGFDWLSSFGEETALIYGVSSFDVEFISNCESGPLLGNANEGHADKLRAGESKKLVYIDHGHNRYAGNQPRKQAGLAPLQSMPAKARSKRPRSVTTKAWTSAVLWSSDDNLPTESFVPELSYLKQNAFACSIPYNTNVDVLSSKKDAAMNRLIKNDDNELYSSPSRKKCRELMGKNSERFNRDASEGTAHNDAYKGDHVDDDVLSQREASARRCTHCLSNKTPQWRAGPLGPKTLCNACGVRYKSGRLFDEYRPAKSPAFLSHKHSNSHKKVVEMRRRKGIDVTSTANPTCIDSSNTSGSGSYGCRSEGCNSASSLASTIASLTSSPSSASSLSMKLKLRLTKDDQSAKRIDEGVTVISTTTMDFLY